MNLNEEFTKEEKEHLSYLGSMLSRPNHEQEDLFERMLEAEEKVHWQRQKHADKQFR